jgi:hypothetical protein
MLTANLGFINVAINNVFTFVATHANEAYLHAAYSGLVSSVLTLHQAFV